MEINVTRQQKLEFFPGCTLRETQIYVSGDIGMLVFELLMIDGISSPLQFEMIKTHTFE